ncbi:MAG TPA: ATP-binding protein [Longimicrobiales bacterium]|nr:ATP-binding protein [Longimicrobiales bacterium]
MPDLGGILFERAPEAILVLSPEGQVASLNREAQRLLALQADQAVGRPILGLVAPGDRDRVKQMFLRVLGGQEREWISRFLRGDGAVRAQWVRAVAVEEGGWRDCIVMFTRDVTEAGAGRPETAQLRTLLEHLPGQFVAVLDTGGRVRYVSGVSRTHFRDEVGLLGAPYTDLLEPGDESHLVSSRMLLEALEGGDWGGTQWHLRADGAVFPALTLAIPYRDPRTGRSLGALVVGRDVSAEHRWRFRAEQAERLAGVGGLVAGVAGQMRRAADRVATALGFGLPDDAAQAGYSVPLEVGRVRALVEAVERLAGVSWALRHERLFLLHEAERAALEVAPKLAAKGGRLSLDVPDGLPPLHWDGEQIRAVLRVLLENAVESLSSSGGGEVRVACSLVSGHERIRIEVSDNGSGIPPEDLHLVTEPFFSTKPEHAGLGLAVVRTVVSGHGGTLAVESPGRGRGSTVTVELPREPPGTTVRFRAAPLALRAARSVLIVDDEPTVRLSVRRFLERVGYDVREAWSGRSALAQITGGTPPELVVTDLRMGDGSGAWLMEQLARDFPDLLRRTVILTGAGEEDELAVLTRQTGCPLLRKPLEMPQLLDALDEVASRD